MYSPAIYVVANGNAHETEFVCVYMLTSLDVPSPAAADTAATAGRWSPRSPRWSVPGPNVSSAAAVYSAHPGWRRKQHTQKKSFSIRALTRHKCSVLPLCTSLQTGDNFESNKIRRVQKLFCVKLLQRWVLVFKVFLLMTSWGNYFQMQRFWNL